MTKQTERRWEKCKYFLQTQFLSNLLITNVLQNLLFCIPKAALLHGKSVCFALQKSRFRSAKSKLAFFLQIIFTKPKRFPRVILEFLEALENLESLEQLYPPTPSHPYHKGTTHHFPHTSKRCLSALFSTKSTIKT